MYRLIFIHLNPFRYHQVDGFQNRTIPIFQMKFFRKKQFYELIHMHSTTALMVKSSFISFF